MYAHAVAVASILLSWAVAGEVAQVAKSAQPADAAAILKRVDDHYNHLRSLRTRFTERYDGLGMNRSESGVLLLQKPGRMRWDYTSPAGKVFVLDGKFAWSYTPGDAQVQRISAKQMDDLRSPLRFLLGHTQLAKELQEISIVPDGTGYRIAGIPKGLAERVRHIALRTTDQGQITAMRVDEVDGAATEFLFEGSQENVPLDGSTFRYVPPAGVGVVDGLPPV